MIHQNTLALGLTRSRVLSPILVGSPLPAANAAEALMVSANVARQTTLNALLIMILDLLSPHLCDLCLNVGDSVFQSSDPRTDLSGGDDQGAQIFGRTDSRCARWLLHELPVLILRQTSSGDFLSGNQCSLNVASL